MMWGKFNKANVNNLNFFEAIDSSSNTRLHTAAANGDLSLVKELLTQGANIACTNNKGQTALNVAENKSVIVLLHERSVVEEWIQAAKEGGPDNEAFVKKFIAVNKNNRARINTVDREGRTALIYAALRGDAPMVKSLLEVPGLSVNATDRYKTTALMYAYKAKHQEIVQDLCVQYLTNNTDLRAKTSVVQKLKDGPLKPAFDAKVSIDPQKLESKLHKYNLLSRTYGTPNFITAARNGNLRFVMQYIIENSLYKLKAKHQYVVQEDCEAFTAADILGDTALIAAAEMGHQEIVEALLNTHINIHFRNLNGETAWDKAKKNGHQGIISLLEQYEQEERFLMAAKMGKYQIVQKFVASDYGKNKKFDRVRDRFGNTALMLAARYGELPIVRLLLNKGARPEQINKNLNTARYEAINNFHNMTAACIPKHKNDCIKDLRPLCFWSKSPSIEKDGGWKNTPSI